MNLSPSIRSVRSYAVALLLCCVIAVPAATAQTFTKLADFDFTNGFEPVGPLVQAADGNLYGITLEGGSTGQGTVYRLGLDGGLTTIHTFCAGGGTCPDGVTPRSLVLNTDGNLYGVTQGAGQSSDGTVFQMTLDGAVTVIHNFTTTEGISPNGIIRARDGNFYGTTLDDSTKHAGTIFAFRSDGRFRVLHNFCQVQGCDDGASPMSSLVQGSDGNLYGETIQGINGDAGLIFKITRSGVYSVVHNFCSLTNCADGRLASTAALVRGRDGNLYGSTSLGGSGSCTSGCGTFFKITNGGALTTLHDFQAGELTPPGSLVLARDGNFYGFSTDSQNRNVIVRITPQGVLTALYTMSQADGQQANSLMQANNGDFYGTALVGGGAFFGGTVFRFGLN